MALIHPLSMFAMQIAFVKDAPTIIVKLTTLGLVMFILVERGLGSVSGLASVENWMEYDSYWNESERVGWECEYENYDYNEIRSQEQHADQNQSKIIGHASTGFAAMEILFHTSCTCAKRMERALIARVRQNTDIAPSCRNKSDGGEGLAGNAPIFFVYVAYTMLVSQNQVPDFSAWHAS